MRRIFITLSMMMFWVASNLSAQEITPGKAVDLGLPSGTIWAAWNVGATSPEQFGTYYSWGETVAKSDYEYDTYKYYKNKKKREYKNIGLDISGTKYDVARLKWGGSWRMPTKEEFDELLSYCVWERITYKGVIGSKVIGPNGNSIFLPAARCRPDTSPDYDGQGFYWSATIDDRYEVKGCQDAWYLNFGPGGKGIRACSRFWGHSVRPVIK